MEGAGCPVRKRGAMTEGRDSDGKPVRPSDSLSNHEAGSSTNKLRIINRSGDAASRWAFGEGLEKSLNGQGFVETIDLGYLFDSDVTTSGSFDVRGEIWATTFGKVLQALPVPAALISQTFKLWAMNEAWKRLTTDYVQLLGTPFAELMAQQSDKDKMSRLLDHVFVGRRAQVSEGMLRLGRGQVWARMTFRSIRIKGERFVLLVVEDLTTETAQLKENTRLRRDLERRVEERTAQFQKANEALKLEVHAHKQTLEALEASERRYRTVVEDQTEMIYRFLPDGTLNFLNPAFAHFLGESPDMLCNWNVFDVMPVDYSRKLKQILVDLKGKTTAEEFEHRLLNAQGEHRWTSWSVRTTRDEKGTMNAVQCVGRDITERKAAAVALRKSEELLRAVFESTRDIIFVKDRDLRITHWNPSVENLLGTESSQLRGRRTDDIFDPETASQILELDRRALRGEVVEVETTWPILGGAMTFLAVVSPLLSPQREVFGICMIARDITSRKKLGTSKVAKADQFVSVSMQATMERARFAAQTDSTILLQGETGTGKDFLARWIHDHSSRANFSYVSINCATLPADLAESELFGHERGAFTGAVTRKRGLLEISEGGTLLLNEIGELSLALQAKLLTFLDTRTFLRVGGNKDVSVNARLIAATHRDLRQEISAGRFLEPLYYRLNVLRIDIPPLRDRLEDIPILVERLYEELTSKMLPAEVPEIETTSIQNLSHYHWPGNIRELKNVLERALMMARGNRIFLRPPLDEPAPKDAGISMVQFRNETLGSAVDKLTKLMCEEALRQTGGNRIQAAKKLGISRGALYRSLRRFEIE